MDDTQKQLEELQRQQMEMRDQMLDMLGIDLEQPELDFAQLAQQGAQEMMAALQDLGEEDAAAMLLGGFDGEDEEEEVGFSDEERAELDAFAEKHPAPPQYEAVLPVGALLSATHYEPYNTLTWMGDAGDAREILREGWDITTREAGIEMLNSLLDGRHTKQIDPILAQLRAGAYAEVDPEDAEMYEASFGAMIGFLELPRDEVLACKTVFAWDLERVGYLARLYHSVGFFTEEEAGEWTQRAAARVKECFADWPGYYISLLFGRGLHMGVSEEVYAVMADLLGPGYAFLETHPIEEL